MFEDWSYSNVFGPIFLHFSLLSPTQVMYIIDMSKQMLIDTLNYTGPSHKWSVYPSTTRGVHGSVRFKLKKPTKMNYMIFVKY
jgi:hypothetical protein